VGIASHAKKRRGGEGKELAIQRGGYAKTAPHVDVRVLKTNGGEGRRHGGK